MGKDERLSSFMVVPASEDDVPELAALLGILFSQESEFTPDCQIQERGLRMIIAEPSVGQIFVLKKRTDKAVCGMVNLLFTVSTALGGRVAVLEDLVIKSGYRHRGLGSLLVKEAAGYAEEAGLKRISLLTDSTNINAISFYNKNSFRISQMIVMRKML